MREFFMKLKDFKKLEHLCSSCKFRVPECNSKNVKFGIDLFPKLKGCNADKVVSCDNFESK